MPFLTLPNCTAKSVEAMGETEAVMLEKVELRVGICADISLYLRAREGMGEKYWCIPEVVPRLYALHLIQRRITRSNHRHGSRCHTRPIKLSEIPSIPQRLQRLDHNRPSRRPIRLHIHKQIQRLPTSRIINPIPRPIRQRASQIRTRRVLLVQHTQDRLDVEAVECPGGGEGGFFVSDVQGGVVEPDVCFDAYGSGAEGGIEGEGAPVVVVGVEGFGDDALG